jgi:sulfonate transport system substrate-binding protein
MASATRTPTGSFFRRLLLCAAMGASLASCKASPKPEEKSEPTAVAAAQPQAGAPATQAAPAAPAQGNIDYGKPGDPIQLVVGYQPYYTESWSGLVLNGLGLWKKHLPEGSKVEFQIGLQGAIIVNAMLAGKQQLGYVGDMPGIVATTKREVADIRIVANVGLSNDQCNVFFTRNDAPAFASAEAAIKWLDGKTVAVPKGSCTDRFARAVFKKYDITPKEYLNQNIELITSGFRANKLDAAVIWEPTASRLVSEKLARRVASGNDVAENDGAFLTMRADLIQQRPDIVHKWLEAELEAEQYLADPKNAREVVRMAKEQTNGFDEKTLWASLFGTYPKEQGGSAKRLTVPFGFTPASLELITRATTFLYEVKSISVGELPPEAVRPEFTQAILKERGLTPPVGEVQAAGNYPSE